MTIAPLDTRSPFRVRQHTVSLKVALTPSETQGFPVGVVVFRQLVRELLRAPRRDRAAILTKVVNHIQASREPVDCVNHLLFECAANGGTDGLDIAIDVLAQVGDPALIAANRFIKAEGGRWKECPPWHSVNDDVWYALLRGVGRSDLPWFDKLLTNIETMRRQPPPGVMEAVVHALGDMAERSSQEQKSVILALLHMIADRDALAPPPVKATIEEVLRDMED